MDFRVLSIGTLPAHPLWGERAQARSGHATCSLVRSGDAVVVVDPGLPPEAIVARLHERTGLRPSDVTHVFLTSFRPDTRRGVLAFEHATWWLSEQEREQVGVPLLLRLKQEAELSEDEGDAELIRVLRQDAGILERCRPAPDTVAKGVDLFPLPGVSPGTCGLLLEHARFTLLVCGDAVPTLEHVERGQVLAGAVDVEQARESFREALEIADLLVPGRDNLMVNPMKKLF